MSSYPGNLTALVGALYSADGASLRKELVTNPDAVMDRYGLSAWQREVLFSLDRKQIAEAVYWEIVAYSPYGEEQREVGAVNVRWPDPERKLLSVPATIRAASDAKLVVETKGLRPQTSTFVLVSLSVGVEIPGKVLSQTGDLEKQEWKLEFSLADARPGDLLRFVVHDSAGDLAWPDPVQVTD